MLIFLKQNLHRIPGELYQFLYKLVVKGSLAAPEFFWLPFERLHNQIENDCTLGQFSEHNQARVKFNLLVMQCFVVAKVLIPLLKSKTQALLAAALTDVIYR